MHFCPKCGNMYYLKLLNKDEDKLIYYCRNCGNEDTSLATNMNNLYVSKTTIKKQMNYKNVINKYTKLDPTLPRITILIAQIKNVFQIIILMENQKITRIKIFIYKIR